MAAGRGHCLPKLCRTCAGFIIRIATHEPNAEVSSIIRRDQSESGTWEENSESVYAQLRNTGERIQSQFRGLYSPCSEPERAEVVTLPPSVYHWNGSQAEEHFIYT